MNCTNKETGECIKILETVKLALSHVNKHKLIYFINASILQIFITIVGKFLLRGSI
ncbi:MAG: hypothetical protein HXK70_06380 [Clostridiales bacterium]|nr:hypothetical protein [Clostridiales bacterium]